MDIAAANITYEESAQAAMEERGITEEDLRQVIAWAEGEGGRLVSSEGCFLGKKRLDKFTVYAQYAIAGEDISVSSAYSHRVGLRSDE